MHVFVCVSLCVLLWVLQANVFYLFVQVCGCVSLCKDVFAGVMLLYGVGKFR